MALLSSGGRAHCICTKRVLIAFWGTIRANSRGSMVSYLETAYTHPLCPPAKTQSFCQGPASRSGAGGLRFLSHQNVVNCRKIPERQGRKVKRCLWPPVPPASAFVGVSACLRTAFSICRAGLKSYKTVKNMRLVFIGLKKKLQVNRNLRNCR